MDATGTEVKPELVIGDNMPVLLSPLLDVERFRLADDGFLRRYAGLLGGGGAGTIAPKLSGCSMILPLERVFATVDGAVIADVLLVTAGVDVTENIQSLVRPQAHIVEVGAFIAPL